MTHHDLDNGDEVENPGEVHDYDYLGVRVWARSAYARNSLAMNFYCMFEPYGNKLS